MFCCRAGEDDKHEYASFGKIEILSCAKGFHTRQEACIRTKEGVLEIARNIQSLATVTDEYY